MGREKSDQKTREKNKENLTISEENFIKQASHLCDNIQLMKIFPSSLEMTRELSDTTWKSNEIHDYLICYSDVY